MDVPSKWQWESPGKRPCTFAEAACIEVSMEAVEASKNRLKCCGRTLDLMEVRRSQWKYVIFLGIVHENFHQSFHSKLSWKLPASMEVGASTEAVEASMEVTEFPPLEWKLPHYLGRFHGNGRSYRRSSGSFHELWKFRWKLPPTSMKKN